MAAEASPTLGSGQQQQPGGGLRCPYPASEVCRSVSHPQIRATAATAAEKRRILSRFEYLFNFDNAFEIHDDIEVLKRMGMAFGLESGSCSAEDLKNARSLVPKALEPYVTEMAQGSISNVYVSSSSGSASNGTRFSNSDYSNGGDGMLATSSNGSQYSGSRVETPVSYVGDDDDDDDDDFNENDDDD